MSQPLSAFDAAAVLIVLAAVLGYINHRFLKLPASIGLTMMGAVASLGVIAVDHLIPGGNLSLAVGNFLDHVDFHTTLMNGMLSFLLFAGAMHIRWHDLKQGFWPVLVLSTVGTIASTLLVGFGFLWLTQVLGLPVPAMWCFVFGALISPTDPVAVIAVLKRAAVPPALEATVAGESLFNDGVGVVIFTIVLAAAMGGGDITATHAIMEFVRETGGGIALGAVTGAIALFAMSRIDDYNVEVIITLAVVMGGYSLGQALGVSGPVAMAVAGLIIGNIGLDKVMSATTRDYVQKFWALIDEILNAVLFLLIGLEVIAISKDARLILVGLCAVPMVLVVRAISVVVPMAALRPFLSLGRLAIPVLVWGGLRGGIAIALALSLPNSAARTIILAATYIIVLFSVIVQGGSIATVVKRLTPAPTLH